LIRSFGVPEVMSNNTLLFIAKELAKDDIGGKERTLD